MQVAVGCCRAPRASPAQSGKGRNRRKPGRGLGCQIMAVMPWELSGMLWFLTLATLSFSPSAQRGAVPCCR